MSSCVGWFFDVSIERDQVVIWIKTEDKKILRLRDSYRPSFYILPRNEYDGLCLFQILSQQQDIVTKVSWDEDKITNLFDYDCHRQEKTINLRSVTIDTVLLTASKEAGKRPTSQALV